MKPVLPALVFALAATAAGQARPWQASDFYRFGMIDFVESSTGGQVLFDVTRADMARDEFTSAYFIRTQAGRTKQIGQGLHISEAHWSPSGRQIAVTATDSSGILQLYVLDAVSGSVRQLTRGPRSTRRFAWSPDGEWIAAVETAGTKSARPPLSFWFDPDSDVLAAAPPARELWRVDARSGDQQRLVSDTYSYGGPVTDHDPSWSADGKRVAVVRQPEALYQGFEHLQVVSVDVSDGAVTPISTASDFELPMTAGPAYSQDGRIATIHTWDGTFAAREDVFVDGKDVSASTDRDFWSCAGSQMAWGGRAVYATAMDGTSMRLYRISPGAAPLPVSPAKGSVEAFSAQPGGAIVIAYSTPEQPAELYTLHPGGALTQLTHVNPIGQGLEIAPTSNVYWKSRDGHTLVGQLTRAPRAGSLLMTEVHGGPQCADDSSFNPAVQYFATNGYTYFRPSPRGSDGYGDWSYKAIVGNWGAGPMDDVMRGVDALVSHDRFDKSRLFLYGASYGGYLTSWTIGHSNAFHAAVAAIPVTDLVLDYTLTQSPNITRRFFGKRPVANNAALLAEESPLRYASKVKTPVMIIAGLRDTQAPYPQAIEYYKILHERGNDVKLLAYPNAGHGPGDPAGNVDWYEHIAGWFFAHGGLRVPGEIKP